MQLGELGICLLSKIYCKSLLRNVSPVPDTLFQVLHFGIIPLVPSLPVIIFHFEHLS